MKHSLLFFTVVFLCSCVSQEIGVVRPELAFTISAETGLTAPRDLTVDDSGNILVFDYNDYFIRKFNPLGELLVTFGGPRNETGSFQHLMAIRALGDSILALDADALFVFDASGQLRKRSSFEDTIICDHPRLHSSGDWAGEWIMEETAEKVLIYRKAHEQQFSKIAAYELAEFFPGIRPAEMFFINPTQVRSYVYDFLPDGQLVWAATDQMQVFVTAESEDSLLFSTKWQPIPFPVEEVQAMKEKQASLDPPLFMNVPENYQLIQHLFIDDVGDIWMYVTSKERTGLVHLSDKGIERGFHSVEAEFDLLSARILAANGAFYFMMGGKDETRVYVAVRP